MTMTASRLLRNFGRGELSFDELLEAWEALPMTLPRHMRQPARTWGEVYREAEEGDGTDIPQAVRAALYAGEITEPQAEQLLKIYRRKLQ